MRRRFRDRTGDLRAPAGELGQLFGGAIIDEQVVAGIQEAPSHRLAHAAEAYESNLHDQSP